MKYQSLFSGNNKKNIIILLSAEFAQRVVKANMNHHTTWKKGPYTVCEQQRS